MTDTSPTPLVFPRPEHPRVSVIVVAWRDAPHLAACLEALHRTSSDVTYEVVVALNEPTKQLGGDLARQLDGVHFVESQSNLGFAAACNDAVATSHGELVLLLNDDVLLNEGSLGHLVASLDGHPQRAAAGSKFLHPDGQLQEAGAVLWSDGSVFQISHLIRPPEALVNRPRRCDYCSGASLLVRRSMWDEVGGMDEGFYPAYYEDVDLCLKIAARGGSVWYEPRSVVRHIMGSSASLRYREYLVSRNRQRLAERWPGRLALQDPPPEHMIPELVFPAVDKAAALPESAETATLAPLPPPGPRVPRRSTAKVLRQEQVVLRSFASALEDRFDQAHERAMALDRERHQLEQDLLWRQSDIAHRDQIIGRLNEAVELRDRHLAQTELQLETMARSRQEAMDSLNEVLARPGVRLVEKLAATVRSIPGAQSVARSVLRLLAH